MFVCGVDGCRGGWVGVLLAGTISSVKIRVFPDIQALWDAWRNATCILIDIPIGLREGGPAPRECDAIARQILRWPRSSSIFPVPCRAAIYASTYKTACTINREKTAKGVSKQAWNIIPKIRQVDVLLCNTPSARQVIRESHPELCFWALGGGRTTMHYKKTLAGMEERFQILECLYPGAKSIVEEAQTFHSRDAAGIDDIIDAMALAISAYLAKGKLDSIPINPECDAKGLPMEMCFFRVTGTGKNLFPISMKSLS